jgi:hypothetical protein
VRNVILIILFLIYELTFAQQTIAFQGFENTAQDSWTFTPPTQNPSIPIVQVGVENYGAGYARTGNFCCRLGGGSTTCGTGSANCVNGAPNGGSCNNNANGQELSFNAVNIAGFTDVTLSIGYRTHILCGSGGPGLDASDRIFFEVQLDGGPWITAATVNGANDCIFNYNTNPVQCGSNTAIANPYIYEVPECTETIAFRVRISVNRADEVVYVDDIHLQGIPGGIVFNPIQIQHIDP